MSRLVLRLQYYEIWKSVIREYDFLNLFVISLRFDHLGLVEKEPTLFPFERFRRSPVRL